MVSQQTPSAKSTETATERRFTSAPEMRLSEPEGDALPQIKGYAALFDDPYDVGWFKERIQRGAFKESLENGDDIRALFNHDPNLILGRASAGTLRLGEDKKGLWYSIDAPDTQLGRDLVESLRRGDITQSSFAFETIEDQWHTNDGEEERILIRAKLWDVSPTTFGANANTTSEAATRSHDLWVASKPTADHGDIEERQAMLRELSGGKPE